MRPWIGRCGSIFWRATQFHQWLFRVEGAIWVPSFLGTTRPASFHAGPLGQAVLLLRREPDAQFVAGGGRQRHHPRLAVLRRVLEERAVVVLFDGAADGDEAAREVEVAPEQSGDLTDPEAGEAGEHAGGVDLQARALITVRAISSMLHTGRVFGRSAGGFLTRSAGFTSSSSSSSAQL